MTMLRTKGYKITELLLQISGRSGMLNSESSLSLSLHKQLLLALSLIIRRNIMLFCDVDPIWISSLSFCHAKDAARLELISLK